MRINLDLNSADDYRRFLAVKALPMYRFVGRTAVVPDEYAHRLGLGEKREPDIGYEPTVGLWDYQRDISAMAIAKRRFAVFADCGLGKTLIMAEFARHAQRAIGPEKCVVIVSPLMVIPQTVDEIKRFYGDSLQLWHTKAAGLDEAIRLCRGGIIITNYEALRDSTPRGCIGALILDESSMLKSHYGKWAGHCLRLGAGLEWKLCLTGTPAPNDRIEYANHAVLLDAFPTVNAFLARFFVNKGQTSERWVLKPHAMEHFYRELSHWCIFLTNPATYGWDDNTEPLPPIHIHIDDVPLTDEQESLAYEKTGTLFANNIGGIGNRSVLAQIAKGNNRGKRIDTNKTAHIRDLVESWPDESTIIWCKFNAEQALLEECLPNAASIKGSTGDDDRLRMVSDFKAGRVKVMISKPKILGFGLNLQIATRQIFSGLHDSYEEFYQAVKRSNRYGAERPLNVHIPVTDIERPMVQTVLDKAHRVQIDTEQQERIFRRASIT